MNRNKRVSRGFRTLLFSLVCAFVCSTAGLAVYAEPASAVSSDPSSSLSGNTNPAATLSAEQRGQLDELLAHFKVDQPGGYVCVVRDGDIIYGKGFGLSDLETKAPFSENSKFELASCSKQFTAVAILILAEQGKLSLDDNARKYLPELPETNPPIKIRHLLAMSSGFTDYENVLSEKELSSFTNADLLAWTAKQKIKFPAGARFDYNNGNYVFLAMLVERVSGIPFRDFLTKNIFEPAGMTDTCLMDKAGMQIANRVGGYKKASKKGWVFSRLDTAIYGDGQVITTPRDLAKWDKALNDGVLLKGETLQQAFVNQKLNNGSHSDYGFGFGMSAKQPGVVQHSGDWNGTSTYIARYLGKGSVQVLSNEEGFDAKRLGDKVGQIVFRNADTGRGSERGAIPSLIRWVGIVLF